MRTLVLALLLALTVGPKAAEAGALGVSPVGFELSAGQRTAVLTVRNDGDTPISVQVRVFRWSQSGEGEDLVTTTDVVVSPPISSLAGRADQIVRVVRLNPAPVDHEETYRVIVDELPAPSSNGASQVVTLLMRHSIPLFFEPGKPLTAAIQWHVEPNSQGPMLVAVNTGGRRQRIADLVVRDAGDKVIGEHKGLLGYVLANGSARWPCPVTVANAGAPSRLTAETDLGRLNAPIMPSKP